MYIWRKRATTPWLRNRKEGLVDRFGPALAIIERPGKARALLEVATTKQQGRELIREFGGTIQRLEADWLQRFARQHRTSPLRIGSRLIVARDPKFRGAKTIVIPAEAAFGTGEHPTTAMCLRMLERITRKCSPGWRMLDAGTGSGILAIAGRYFGAGEVIAIDNDPVALRIARRNARANGVDHLRFEVGDVLKQKLRGKFDFITANLLSEILIAALPKWSRHLARDGSLILSGILRSEEKALLRALRGSNCLPREIRRRGKWIALLAVRRQEKG